MATNSVVEIHTDPALIILVGMHTDPALIAAPVVVGVVDLVVHKCSNKVHLAGVVDLEEAVTPASSNKNNNQKQ